MTRFEGWLWICALKNNLKFFVIFLGNRVRKQCLFSLFSSTTCFQYSLQFNPQCTPRFTSICQIKFKFLVRWALSFWLYASILVVLLHDHLRVHVAQFTQHIFSDTMLQHFVLQNLFVLEMKKILCAFSQTSYGICYVKPVPAIQMKWCCEIKKPLLQFDRRTLV